MKKETMTLTDIIKKLRCMEQEIKGLREAIERNMEEPVGNTEKAVNTNLQYTLEDLYEAFGNRKHYAVRLKNALNKRGITTLPNFLALSPGELLELDNVGPETLQKTKKALDRLGIRW